MHLSWVDIAIVLIYVAGTILAGTVARGAIRNISDFLVAGRTLRTHMAVATIVSTGLGAVEPDLRRTRHGCGRAADPAVPPAQAARFQRHGVGRRR